MSIGKLYQLSLFKTLRINFKHFKFREAIKFPILVSRGVNFRSLKGNIKIEGNLSFGMIQIGFDTLGLVDWPKERAVIQNEGSIIFKGRATIGAASKIIVLKGGKVEFGQNFTLTGKSNIIAKNSVEIGNDCLISWDVQIMDTDFHHIQYDNSENRNKANTIVINQHVWVCSRVTILKGVEIAGDSIIAAGSLVTKDCTYRNSLYGGNPAKRIKSDIKWRE